MTNPDSPHEMFSWSRVRRGSVRPAGEGDQGQGWGDRFKQWLATRDRQLLLLVILTVIGLVVRWILAVGFMLGDDISYTDLIRDITAGQWMEIVPAGQYCYRPMWVYPLAASIKLFGWSRHTLVLYPVITGSLIPMLMALWIRRHLPRGSLAPILCAVLLSCYPTLFMDSVVLANEIPMIFWCLVSVNFFGLAYAQLAQTSKITLQSWRLGLWSLLAGAALGAAYQVKSAAIPLLGLWLTADLWLHLRRHGWPKWGPLGFAAAAFLIPVVAIQAFYFHKLGHPLGNFTGELHFYDMDLPPDYFAGKFNNESTLAQYPAQLFQPDGYVGYRILLHGIWTWLGAGLAVLTLLGWKKIPAEQRVLMTALIAVTVILYLFLQYWPTRLKPYYIPNCFAGRPWRYMDAIGPTTGAFVAIFLTLPVFDRRWFHVFRVGLVAGGLGVAGYCVMIRSFEFTDRAAEFRGVTADQAILAPYRDVSHYIDVDGFGMLRAALGMPKKPELVGRGSGQERVVVDFRRTRGGCVWTGGARRYGVNADDAWSPDQVQAIGGELRLVHTWDAGLRPWRLYPLQLWAFQPAPLTIHDHPPPH